MSEEIDDPRDTIIMVLAAQIQKDKAEISFLQTQLQHAYEAAAAKKPQLQPLPQALPLPPVQPSQPPEKKEQVTPKPPAPEKNDSSLWIGLADVTVTQIERNRIRSLFSEYGHINDLYFHPLKKYAIVRMRTSDAAQRALKALDGIRICGHKNFIRVKPFKSKY